MIHGARARRALAGTAALALAIVSSGAPVRAEDRADGRQRCVDAYVGGQQLRLDRRLMQTRDKLLVCAQRTCPGFIQAECTRWLAEVEAALPSVVVIARDESGAAVSIRDLRIDGESAPAGSAGASVTVDPGEHTFEIWTPDGGRASSRVVVREGEKSQPITIAVRRATFASAQEGREKKPSGLPASAWVLGALGVAGLAGYAFFGIQGLSMQLDLQSKCSPRCSAAEVSSLRTRYLAADIGLGVAVAAASGLTIVLLRRPSSEQPASGASRLGLGVAFDGGGLRMSASSSF